MNLKVAPNRETLSDIFLALIFKILTKNVFVHNLVKIKLKQAPLFAWFL